MTNFLYDYKAQIPDDWQQHAKFVDGKHVVDVAPMAELEAMQSKIDTMVMQKALSPYLEDIRYDLKPSVGKILTQMALEEFEVLENGEIRNKSMGGASLRKWIRTDLRKSSPFLYVHGNTTELDKSGNVWIPNEEARAKLTTAQLWELSQQEKQI